MTAGDSFDPLAYRLRNSANRAPATIFKNPGLAPGLFLLHPIRAFEL